MAGTDYGQLLAQMIAQARPQAVQTGGGRRIASGAPLQSTERSTNVGVQIPSPEKLEGYKRFFKGEPPRETMLAEAEAAYTVYSKVYNDDPQRAESYMSSPTQQKKIEQWSNAGFGKAYQREDGIWSFVPGPPPTMEEVKAKLSRVMEMREQQGVSDANVAPGAEAGPSTPAPAPQAQTLSPQQQRFIGAGVQTPAEALTAEEPTRRAYISGASEVARAGVRDQARVEDSRLRQQADRNYAAEKLNWEQKSILSKADEKSRFSNTQDLEAITTGRIYDVLQFPDSARAAAPAIAHYASVVDRDMHTPLKGGSSSKDQIARRRYNVNSLTNMLTTSNQPPGRLHLKLYDWMKYAGYNMATEEGMYEVYSILRSTGISDEDIKRLFKAKPKAKPGKTTGTSGNW